MDPSKLSQPAAELDRLFAEAQAAVEQGSYDRGMQALSKTLALPVHKAQEELRFKLIERLREIQPNGNTRENAATQHSTPLKSTAPKATEPPTVKASEPTVAPKNYEQLRRLAKERAARKKDEEVEEEPTAIDRYVHPDMLFGTWNIKSGRSLPENDPKISEALVRISKASRELNAKTRFSAVHMIVAQLERHASQGEVAINTNAMAILRALLVGRSLLSEEQLEEDDL